MISPRSNFITLLNSKRQTTIQKTREAYLGTKNSYALKLNKNKNTSCDDRNSKTTNRKNSLNRSQSFNRDTKRALQSLTSRKMSKQKLKKDLNAWSKTCLSLTKQNYQEQKKRNDQGNNCRIVIMNNGKVQNEHFLQVKAIQDVNKFISGAYPRNTHFSTVPRQVSLQFLFTQSDMSGQFLNGQAVYLKPEPNYQAKEKVGLQNFQIIKQIGSGGFSKVFLVKSKNDGKFYAMKLIEKDMVIKNKKKKILMNERVIMEQSKHPFIVELKYAFQSEKYLVFVLQYCAGGQLFGLIKKYRRLTQQMARFYIIQILLGLAYLHSQKVVYRDIKPENILIGIDGHVKIADLGLAKPNMDEGQLAYSFCGSPQYMSPEMIMQVGHTYPVDFYCLGALLYELLFGLPPFYSQDPEQIYEAVLAEDVVFPDDVPLTAECRNLLKSLLCKDPKHRLGSLYGTKQILAHPWFGKQNYQNFLNKVVEPPVNFKSLRKLNMDVEENDKNKDSLDRVIKQQKYENRQFKQIMKNFYFTHQPPVQNKRLTQRKFTTPISPRHQPTDRNKQNFSSTLDLKSKIKKSGAVMSRNPLHNVFNK